MSPRLSRMSIRPITICPVMRKYTFASRRDARRYLKTRRMPNFYACAVYRCPHCNGWHLTKQPRRAPDPSPSMPELSPQPPTPFH